MRAGPRGVTEHPDPCRRPPAPSRCPGTSAMLRALVARGSHIPPDACVGAALVALSQLHRGDHWSRSGGSLVPRVMSAAPAGLMRRGRNTGSAAPAQAPGELRILCTRSASRAALAQAPGRGDRERERIRKAAMLASGLALMCRKNLRKAEMGTGRSVLRCDALAGPLVRIHPQNVLSPFGGFPSSVELPRTAGRVAEFLADSNPDERGGDFAGRSQRLLF